MADADRCPKCGAERVAGAPAGLCARCLMRQVFDDETADVGTRAADLTTAPAPVPTPTHPDAESTRARPEAPLADPDTAPADATSDWTPVSNDRIQTATGREGSRDVPRGTTVSYFGDYELQKELGRGGMGVVYKARQVSLNRLVALKMIKAGVLADDAELHRFQNEAEAVALLDHAGIVPVYEVGVHEGQKYFSMKLVEGGNLAERLAGFPSNPKAAAALLAETAEAVHHAHMRGVLHRDLKPANILIDAEGHPHVTDFGLAKRVEGDVEMTQSGAILGTPAYMSPEQAAGRRGSITTATDVYGLGAILYALLTGKAPFGGESVLETLDAVRTLPPEPPQRFNAQVPRDLETICLKCLEKDPRRRYASAHELADDLRNWLDSRPIAARRVGAAERAWLWCKRRPAVAALSGAVLLATIAGTAAVFAVQSRAKATLEAANAKLKRANTELEQERERVEVRERQAVDAIQRFGDAIANEPILKNSPVLDDLRRRLLREPIAFFQSLRDQLQADAKTRPESLLALSSAAFQHAQLSQTVGDRNDASRSFTESLAVLERLVREHPSETDYQGKLASSHAGLGFVQMSIGQPREARESIERAAELYADLLRQGSPLSSEFRKRLAQCQLMLGILEHQGGRPGPALDLLRKARDDFEQLLPLAKDPSELRADLVMCHIDIGGVEEVLGRFADALSDFRLAAGIADRLVGDHPSVAAYQVEQAKTHGNIGKMLSRTGAPDEAEAAFDRSRAIYESLATEYPTTVDHQSGLAGSCISLGAIAARSGRMTDAESRFSKARAILERLAADHPESPDFASELGTTLHNLGQMQLDATRFAQARDLLLEALVWQRKALASSPANPRYRECLNAHLGILAEAATALDDKETVEQARQELARIAASDPRKAALDERLAQIGQGATPRDDPERLALAQRAFETRRFAVAVRFWAEALANSPALANDRRGGHRYNAACAAVLAAAGQGTDDPQPDDAAQAELRQQAFDWLEAELAVWSTLLESANPQQRAFIAQTLQHWKQDADLAGIRDEKELARLAEAEQKEWQALWAKVETSLERAQAPDS